jgi:hypothetical protein
MGRPRQYDSDAERQRAFRERERATIARVDRRALDRLHGRLDELQAALWRAAAGDETARACQAAGIETMLERLTAYFAQRGGRTEPGHGPAASGAEPAQEGRDRVNTV